MQGIPQGPGSQNSSGGSQKPSLSWQSPGSSVQNKPAAPQDKPKPAAPVAKTNNKAPQANPTMGMYAGIFIAGLIVGGLLGSIIVGHNMMSSVSSATNTASSTTSATDLTGSTLGGGLQGLTVANQKAGSTVSISNISVTKATWVGIYDDVNGLPGKALGVQLFFPTSSGEKTSGAITLLRNTSPGLNYLVGERIDNGDHIYATASDAAVADSNGTQLTLKFQAQ